MGELIMALFHARTTAHVLHLKTRSYAAHIALNEFYDALLPLTDNLAEAYQGDFGLIESFPARYTPHTDALELLDSLDTLLETKRYSVISKEDTYLQNIIDEICALIYSTRYKLKFLK